MSGPRWLVQELTLALILAVHTGVLMVTGATATLSGQQPTSAGVLSEHEIAALDSMTPQQQAELLVERSINHFVGATTQIERRADNWRGKITLTPRLNNLVKTAINSNDLTVRAVALEVDIASRNLDKSSSTLDRLEPLAREGQQGVRVNALWELGLLGNRGIEPDRAARILLESIRDEDINVRYWAVEGLAYLGTDDIIDPLLEIFRYDPSPLVRERAACGLAQSGMLTEKQRLLNVKRARKVAQVRPVLFSPDVSSLTLFLDVG